MSKFYNSPEFKKAQKEWYKRLSDDGFVDIERIAPGGGVSERYLGGAISSLKPLTTPELNDQDRFPPDSLSTSAKMDRYQAAAELALLSFRARRDWEECVASACYADGYSEREISSMMVRSRRKVRELLKNIKHKLSR